MTAFPVSRPVTARIDIQTGRVDVIASSRREATVTVSPSDPARAADRRAADAVRVEHVGGDIVVKGAHRMKMLGPRDSVAVSVELPAGSAVALTMAFGSARLSGSFGAVRAQLSYGDFDLDAAERLVLKGGYGEYRVGSVVEEAEIAFKSGAAEIGRVGGGLRLTGNDGPIRVESVGGPSELSTSSGSIDLGSSEADVALRAAYGSVTVRDAVRGALRIDGSYGDIDVGVHPGTAVWLDATSQHGLVRTDLSADSGPRDGDETLELRIRAGYGSVRVQRSHGDARDR